MSGDTRFLACCWTEKGIRLLQIDEPYAVLRFAKFPTLVGPLSREPVEVTTHLVENLGRRTESRVDGHEVGMDRPVWVLFYE